MKQRRVVTSIVTYKKAQLIAGLFLAYPRITQLNATGTGRSKLMAIFSTITGDWLATEKL
jgi:hypothetical protein